MKNSFYKICIAVTVFSIAMGLLESAVVVYLRELYFPEGFAFPIPIFDKKIIVTELLRELATLVMLVYVGYLAGKNLTTRFAWFIYSFAIWDIFYYVWLKVLLNWPMSIMDDDLLFLIPVIWVGPVITPVIISITMIVFAFILIKYSTNQANTAIALKEWLVLTVGSLLIILGFTWDYSQFILENHSFSKIWILPGNETLYSTLGKYIPQKFNWFLFVIGELFILTGIFIYWLRQQNKRD